MTSPRELPETNRQKMVREKAERSLSTGECQWYLGCTRRAVTSVHHPILGDVPCCLGCAAFATGDK